MKVKGISLDGVRVSVRVGVRVRVCVRVRVVIKPITLSKIGRAHV